MSESKTYVFGQDGQTSNGNILSTLVPLLQNKGVDPSVLAMMNNGGFGGNNGFLWAIFLLAIFGGWGNGGFGFGNNGAGGAGFLANQLNNSEGRELLSQAIQGNHEALTQLASTMQVNATAVQSGFNSVMQSLCNIGNQVGMSGQQVINALQNGNMQIAQQIAAASAQSQLGVCQQTNALQTSICDAKSDLKNALTMLGFQSERQTGILTNTIKDSTQTIVDGQKAAEIRELNAILTAKDNQIARLENTISTQQIVNPLTAQLTAISTAIAQLQAAQAAPTAKASTT